MMIIRVALFALAGIITEIAVEMAKAINATINMRVDDLYLSICCVTKPDSVSMPNCLN
ncbi:hypothetical protein QNH20_14925 [Neobacillus sp. WH10]|uniref:hypothetical protein n=1 Tax=Neobacillus sp. WH10 TaxID=3047873 RepID=UPI0024C174A5|nr:hypothetical protein [Neobacillus sp. WH10]WHY75437.1 hypothetical protein QNH20_14925 [Neobacillus sp. WH10]